MFRHTDWVNPGTLTVPSPVGRLYAQAAPTADQMRWPSCFMPGSDFPARFAQSECLGSEAGRQDVLLIGDSHAANLEWGLSRAFPELHVQELAISRCQPTMAHAKWLGTECDAAEKFLYETWIPAHRATPVILSGRWTEDDLDRIGQTIAWFHQLKIPVTLVGPSVEYTQALPRLIDMARSEHDPEVLDRNRLRWPQDLDVRMKALAASSWHVPYISVFDDLCRSLSAAGHSAYNCPVTADGGVTLGGFPDNGVPFLWDAEHTSTEGSERLAQTMREHHQLP